MEEEKMKLKKSILYPVTDFSPYFNLCIRKTHKNTLLKYEVDWIYSTLKLNIVKNLNVTLKRCDCYFIPLKPRKV
jgi:hypothetical protein